MGIQAEYNKHMLLQMAFYGNNFINCHIMCFFCFIFVLMPWKILFGKNKQPCGEIFDCNGKPLVINQRLLRNICGSQKIERRRGAKTNCRTGRRIFRFRSETCPCPDEEKICSAPIPGMDPIPCRYALIARYASLEQTTMFMEKLKNLNLEKRVIR